MASYKPTKKWLTSAITGLAAVATSWIATGAFDDVEKGMLVTLVASLATSYLKSNDPTPGGVPPVVNDV